MPEKYNIDKDLLTPQARNMPVPKPEKAGAGRLAFWAVFALIVVGATVYWLTRAPEQRDALRASAADMINSYLKDTPLAGIGDVLRSTPPPLPPQVLAPPTAKGTLSGRSVTGLVAAPIDLTPGTNSTGTKSFNFLPAREGEAPLVFDQEPVPPITEDSKVQPRYLSEMANWLADRYKPGPRGGTLATNIQGLNHLGGITLAAETKGGRSSLLRYAFQPSMIQGLYNLYINRFMADLNTAAQKKGFGVQENRDFHLALGGRASLIASALESIANFQGLGQRLEQIDTLAQKVVDSNAQLTTAVFDLDELKTAKSSATQINAAQMRVDGCTSRYRRAVEDHAQAQRALADELRAKSGQAIDEDTLLFLAAWVERRIAENSNAINSVKSCVAILRDLARRCAQAGS